MLSAPALRFSSASLLSPSRAWAMPLRQSAMKRLQLWQDEHEQDKSRKRSEDCSAQVMRECFEEETQSGRRLAKRDVQREEGGTEHRRVQAGGCRRTVMM